ncbi:dihydrofolate reductase family protein [Actinomadura sp. HBU206391]|uniref:dihydrofolate reductase family protein n=1 Tax=Actinomadura sp. HBU206391 TaxID=2731692 RepID=UPI0016509EF3|nr:dihydrofolate reductase family protein [Actinomadura sp. HBU206391]MBC6462232.1 dihydrofolate reductase [Actinomadura sp. HBU206391]
MRKIIATTYTTLDGFIDNPHLWSMKYSNEEAQAYAVDLLFGSDALLLGRVTYEGMAAAWPSMGGNPYADRANSMAKYVVSSTLEKAEWNNSTIIPGDDLVTEVTRLKQQPGQNILIWGCGRLTDTLMEHGLLDEYRIWVYPVILGKGERLFREGVEATLRHEDTTTFSTGVVVLTYRPVSADGDAATAG